ncbi:Calcium/calmodulin-dependent 3',5'-cyclic nucleotide phosphodiesterase 1B [Perkinsus olseni]|uniref:Calcium/calmodulin-dependent 3',5'-cyclic nucleotide phosphodiesterase 1B n=1 Tax=Perkinsus olseni TaxID=32597 RepID=A0A7J6PDR9_PEROL|nr:Calcium/calmodulin-dependent 3',5'-cyclic nucleotide phosphodiesterase 1B [Perkinsus olseni]
MFGYPPFSLIDSVGNSSLSVIRATVKVVNELPEDKDKGDVRVIAVIPLRAASSSRFGAPVGMSFPVLPYLPDLATLLSPSFDIFDYAASNFINKYDVLPVAAMVIFDDVLRNVDLPERRKRDLRSSLQKFAEAVELGYNNAPFHNPIHATDVALALYMLISEKEPLLDPMLSIICYCAALGHDINHPGYSNWYAILNCDGDEDDTHPLETMHARETIRLLQETGVAEFIGKESLPVDREDDFGDGHASAQHVGREGEGIRGVLTGRSTHDTASHAADLCNPTRTRTAMLKWSALWS